MSNYKNVRPPLIVKDNENSTLTINLSDLGSEANSV